MKKACSVCTTIESKYKCPQCRMPYCSVDCYRNHKQSCSVPVLDAAIPSAVHSTDIEEGEVIDASPFEKIALNPKLRNQLSDSRLQQRIRDILTSENVQDQYQQAVETNAAFASFIQLLKETIST